MTTASALVVPMRSIAAPAASTLFENCTHTESLVSASYIEFTFDATANTGYRLWIGRARSATGIPTIRPSCSSATRCRLPDRRPTASSPTNATIFVLEACNSCGEQSWGWEDNGYGGAGPLIYFAATGRHTVRIQSREDGLSIDQIVLSPARYLNAAPGAQKADKTIAAK